MSKEIRIKHEGIVNCYACVPLLLIYHFYFYIGDIPTDFELSLQSMQLFWKRMQTYIFLLNPFLAEYLLKCLPKEELELRKWQVRSLPLKSEKLLQLDKKQTLTCVCQKIGLIQISPSKHPTNHSKIDGASSTKDEILWGHRIVQVLSWNFPFFSFSLQKTFMHIAIFTIKPKDVT